MDKLGCHVSMKAPSYLEGAVREALSYQATALMIYTGPPQNTLRKPVEQLRIEQARALLQENGIPLEHVVVHAPYIINLGNVTSIGTRAFASCDELTHVDLGRVTVIPEDAFFDCGSLSDIDLKYVTSIGPSAFSSCGLTEADLTSVTSLGGSAFCGCFDLTSVKLGGNLTSIEESAFLACEKLTEIDLSHITSIGNDAFVGCTNLTDIRLGSRKDRALPTVGSRESFSPLQTVTVYADFSAEKEAACQQTIAGWFNHVTIQFEPDSAWQNRASKTASLLRSALPS